MYCYLSPSLWDLENLIVWDKSSYLNIWVISKFAGDEVGGVAVPNFGAVLLKDNFFSGVAAPHEVGHYLGLGHVFPSIPGCGCGDGDFLRDTPDLQSYGIGSSCDHEWGCENADLEKINPCTGQPYGLVQKNMMNYTYCASIFTNDQRNLMRETLETYHSSLLGSVALSKRQPVQSARLLGSSVIFTDRPYGKPVNAVCSCNGAIEKLTINGNEVTDNDLYSVPNLVFGGHQTRIYSLTCVSGLTATKTVEFYRLGVSNIQSSCKSEGTYSVSFDNPFGYKVSVSAGIVDGNTITGISESEELRIFVANTEGDTASLKVDIPCCAYGLIKSPVCLPAAENGLSRSFGIESFEFGNSIRRTSSASFDDGSNYVDYSCTERATVDVRQSYRVAVRGHMTQKHYVKVYIDYNADADFTANELVLRGITSGDQLNLFEGNVVIPTHIVTETRLRVRVLADPDSSSNVCTIKGLRTTGEMSGSGQIEDYSIFVNAFNTRTPVKFNPKLPATIKKKLGESPKRELHSEKIMQSAVGSASEVLQKDKSEHITASPLIYVSPNPFTGNQFTVTVPDGLHAHFQLINHKGIEMPISVTETEQSDKIVITGKSRLVPGLYILKIRAKNGSAEKIAKIVIL